MFSRPSSYRFATAFLAIIMISSVAFGASWRDFFGFFSSEPAVVTSSPIVETEAIGASVTTNSGSGLNPTYPNLADAITALNAATITSPVIITVNSSETAPVGGYSITATGTAANTIVIQAASGQTLTANGGLTAGALTDAIFKIIGGDYISISGFILTENAANTTTAAATNNMTEWGVALLYASTTDGAQNNSITNNTIDLNRTYQNTFGIYSNSTHSATTVTTSATATGAAGGNSGLVITGNTITDVNNGIVVVGPTAAADHSDGLTIGGSIPAANSITNFGTTGTFSGYANVSGTVNGILVRNTKNATVSFNTVTSSVGGVTAGTLNGIQFPAFSNAPTGTFTQNVNNNTISVQSGLIAGAMNGINILGTSASITSTINVNNNNFVTSGHTVAGTAAIVFLNQAGTHQTQNILNNTFTNLSVNTTGSVTFILNSNTLPAGGVKNVNGNSIVTGFAKTGGGGTVIGFSDNGSDLVNTTSNVNNNNFSNITLTGATNFTGISHTNGGAPNKTVSGNTINGISGATGTFIGISLNFDGGTTNVATNTVSTVNNGGSTTGIQTGTSGSGGALTTSIFQNTVHSLTGTGTGAVSGMSIGGTTGHIKNLLRNKIYNLENNNAGGSVNGILISSGTTINASNNIIGDLRTPVANAANPLNGINITGGTTVNADFNTVYLNASSAGALFGSSAVSVSTTPNVTLRNNIFVNASTTTGAGLAAAHRRSTTTLTTYNAASNNNDVFGSTIFTDGTNTDATLAAYKARVASRDSASVSENPTFVSTSGSNVNFLHINTVTPTQLEGGGIPVAGITVDFDGDTRNVSTPDIGADEFTGVLLDLTGPNITYAGLLNTASLTNRTLAVNITDVSGVAAGAVAPRIYFKKSTDGAYVSTQCTGSSPSYTCTIDYTLVGGGTVALADVVQYFVVAQDTVGNVSANPSGGFSATNVNTVTSPPTTPSQYTIVAPISGSYDVGSAETVTSLTNASGIFELINNSEVVGNVTINITSDLVAETGTVGLNTFTSPFSVTIKPSGGPRLISGATSANAMIRTVGASNVIIDGSTSGGTDRSLTITNTSVTTPQVVRFGSVGTTPATGNTLKNTIVNNGVNTSSAVVIAGNDGLAGYFNNVTIQNNDIRKAFIGVFGNAAVASGNGSATAYVGNKVDNTGADAMLQVGLYLQGVANGTVSDNVIGNFVNTDVNADTGIWLATGAGNVVVSGNTISGLGNPITGSSASNFGIRESSGLVNSGTVITRNSISNINHFGSAATVGISISGGGTTVERNSVSNIRALSTGTFGAYGIDIVAGDNTTLRNNFISGVTGDMTGGAAFSSTFGIFGIRIGGGLNHKIYNNSVNLSGLRTGTATTSLLTAGLVVAATTSTGLDIRNNIFANNITGGTTGISNVAVALPTGGTAAMALLSNNNSFYHGVDAASGVGNQGFTASAPNLATLPLYAGYTSTLGTATNDNVSIASSGAVPFVSASDLHLNGVVPEVGTGVTIATVTNDIDGDGRPGNLAGEIGADELADSNAPDTTILTNPTNPTNSTTATFTFSGTDTLAPSVIAGFECKLDAGAYAACTSGQTYPGLSDGAHTFMVRAIDFNNNVDPTPASYTWVIDTVAPNTNITANPTNPSNSASATFSFTSTEGGSTFECRIDGGMYTVCTSPQSYMGLSNGSHTFDVRATDAVGNTDATPATYTWTIDTMVPETTILTNPTNPTTDTNATFTFGASGLGATYTFECKLDAGAFSPCTSPQSYMGLAVGPHTFEVRATDIAGNVDPTPASYAWTITGGSMGPVTVTATTGTTGPTDYPTLKDAIDAVNAGTHTGVVTVSIVSNTTETATSVLNGSGAGAASYTALTIRPGADAVTVAGPSAQGRGLIELNGADNVTIDGDNPGSMGTNRNLTIQNTAANTVTFTSVIRVALNITTVASADNNIFRNLNIVGSSTGRNIVAATSTTASENTTFGIFLGPNASGDVTAPTAITSVITGVAAGATATNLIVQNNNVVTAARAVSINGSATTVAPGLQITNNVIGNPTAGNADQVTAIGITANGSANAVISGNLVWVEGYIRSSAATHGINVGVNSANTTGATIEKNRVNRVKQNDLQSWAAYGINLGGGNTHIVRNNFVSGVINDQTGGTGAFGTTFGAYGIRVASGTGHQVYHNSVNLYGAMGGVTSTNLTSALLIVATTQTGLDIRNNVLVNTITGGNPTGTRNVAIYVPTAGTVAMNLTLNNNDYFVGADALNRMAQRGATFGTGEYTLADFDPNDTVNVLNFRNYSNTLSAAGTNDNASKKVDPQFTTATDLHILATSPMESGGANAGVLDDIDGDSRTSVPDIGADEITVAGPGILQFSSTAFSANEGATATINVNRGAGLDGTVGVTATVTDGTATGGAACTAGVDYINPGVQTLSFVMGDAAESFNIVTCTDALLKGNQTVNLTLSMPTGGATIGANNPAVLTIVDVPPPFSGTINVGTGEAFTSLTNPGGLFQALNGAGLSANTTINITSDLTAETGAIVLNQLAEFGAGGYTLTFKPSGGARVISGTSAVNIGLINLNGADRVIFDGSLMAGTDRSLTVTNNQTGTSTVFWIRSASASNGANSNTIKNTIINGASTATAQTTAGILAGSGVTIGGPAEAPNNDNTVTNNHIYRVQNSIYNQGNIGFDQNWTITNNEFGSTVAADKNRFRGMLMGNAQNFVISGNTVNGVQSLTTTTAAMSGIQLAFTLNGGSVVRNKINDIKNVSATGTGAFGMQLSSTSAAANVLIANNFVSDVTALGSATLANNGHGINFNGAGAGGYSIYHNSVNMNTDQASGTTSAMLVQAAGAGGLNIRNNIFANTQTAGATRYSFYSVAANTVYAAINYNDYFSTGSVGFIGIARVTLVDWQTGTGQDVNSLAVNPLFVSPTDLHLQAMSPVLDLGTPIATVTTDIDGDARSATTPDIGADEFVAVAAPGTLQFSAATYSVGEAGPTATITVTRTGGTDGVVGASYSTVAGGTATGGMACGGAVDYANTAGTVSFASGSSTAQTFTIPICDDAAVEGNETVNLALTTPTGGATIGMQNSAVLTITDNDVTNGSFSINDVRVNEGNAGTSTATFTVTYTAGGAAAVNLSTSNVTATAGSDYVTNNGTLSFPASASTQTQSFNVTVNGDTAKEANEVFRVTLTGGGTITDGIGYGVIRDEDRSYFADFDDDLKADYSVHRQSEQRHYVLRSSNGTNFITSFGLATDVAVPGDYDGDGRTDIALYRPSTSTFYAINSSTNTVKGITVGVAGDTPVQGDYNGDGRTDLATFRPASGLWSILFINDGTSTAVNFGLMGDRPVQADYDGDAKTDIAIYRDGVWYILRSSDSSVAIANWGLPADKPVSGDFDGDGRFDLAIYRNGQWWILNSLNGNSAVIAFGLATDVTAAADFDGDGTTDVAVYRPSAGDWYVLQSSNNSVTGVKWGIATDAPIPNRYFAQ